MDGQVRFQARMTYGKEALMALQRAAGKTTRKKYVRLRRGFDFVVGPLMLGDGILMLWTKDFGILTWLMLILGAVFLSFGIFYYDLSVYRAFKAMPKAELDVERIVSFTDTKAQCIAGQTETKFEYGAFQSLYRWSRFLVLFVDARRALLVDEAALTLGTPAELQGFLEEKTGKKVETIH